jgi:hypothetical protein
MNRYHGTLEEFGTCLKRELWVDGPLSASCPLAHHIDHYIILNIRRGFSNLIQAGARSSGGLLTRKSALYGLTGVPATGIRHSVPVLFQMCNAL